MKSILFLQGLFVVATVVAQTPRQRYTAICDSQDGQSKTFDDGYEITYFCRKNGITSSLLTTQVMDNPDECATACSAYSGCKGSSWLYTSRECQIFGEGGTGETVRATVFMRRDSEEGEAGEEGPENATCAETEHALQDCEESEKELTEELQQCRASQQQCQEENETCQDELAHERESCRARVEELERRVPANPDCPRIHDAISTRGGQRYKTWCNHHLGNADAFYKQNNLNFEECLEQCSQESRCKGIQWFASGATARCKLHGRSSGEKGAIRLAMMVAAHKM